MNIELLTEKERTEIYGPGMDSVAFSVKLDQLLVDHELFDVKPHETRAKVIKLVGEYLRMDLHKAKLLLNSQSPNPPRTSQPVEAGPASDFSPSSNGELAAATP